MKPRFLPKFPIFVQDWLSSLRVRGMSLEERGAFLELLLLQWQEGGLPADAERLLRLVGISGSAAVHPLLVGAFPLDADGLRRNVKCASVRAEADAYCASQAEKGRASGRARNRGSTGVEPSSNRRRTQSNPPTPTPTPSSDSENPPNPPSGGAAPGKPARSPRGGRTVADLEAELIGQPPWLGRAAREWVGYRAEAGHKPYTPRGLRAQIRSLAEWGEVRATAALQHSMAGGYQGLFEPPRNGKPAPSAQRPNADAYSDEWRRKYPRTDDRQPMEAL